MKIGIFSPTYSDLSLEDICRKASGLGYEAVELPGFKDGNTHLDVEEIVKGNNAKTLRANRQLG
jgi:sugar phosphate isomerase/epimerase